MSKITIEIANTIKPDNKTTKLFTVIKTYSNSIQAQSRLNNNKQIRKLNQTVSLTLTVNKNRQFDRKVN